MTRSSTMGKTFEKRDRRTTNPMVRAERVFMSRWSNVPGSPWLAAPALVIGWLTLAPPVSQCAVAAPAAGSSGETARVPAPNPERGSSGRAASTAAKAPEPNSATAADGAPHQMRPEHDLRTYEVVLWACSANVRSALDYLAQRGESSQQEALLAERLRGISNTDLLVGERRKGEQLLIATPDE